MNGPTKNVGPPLTPLPARRGGRVFAIVLDRADAIIDGFSPSRINQNVDVIMLRTAEEGQLRLPPCYPWSAVMPHHGAASTLRAAGNSARLRQKK